MKGKFRLKSQTKQQFLSSDWKCSPKQLTSWQSGVWRGIIPKCCMWIHLLLVLLCKRFPWWQTTSSKSQQIFLKATKEWLESTGAHTQAACPLLDILIPGAHQSLRASPGGQGQHQTLWVLTQTAHVRCVLSNILLRKAGALSANQEVSIKHPKRAILQGGVEELLSL